MTSGAVYYYYRVDDEPERMEGTVSLADGKVVSVGLLRNAIWKLSKGSFKKFQGITGPENLLLWLPAENKRLTAKDNLGDVFGDAADKEVYVTSSKAPTWDAPFVEKIRGSAPSVLDTPAAGKTGAALGDASGVLAKQLLVPFLEIPKCVEEVRRALTTPPLQRIPLSEEYLKVVAGCQLSIQMFKLETPEVRAQHISCLIQVAINLCLSRSFALQASMQSYWDCIFCNLWNTLLDLAGIWYIEYSRNTASSSGAFNTGTRSDLSLLVHGKEVVYGDEDSGPGTNAAEQVRKKLKGFLDPQYFLDMSHMICVTTEKSRLCVLAVDRVDFVALLPDLYTRNVEGLLQSILLSINLLRIAVTWAPGFANTPPREEPLNNSSTYGPRNSILRTVKGCSAGVRKTIKPWSEHVGAGYTQEDYVVRAMGALRTYVSKLQVSDDKYEVLIADRGKQRKPTDCEELKACLRDVLTSLSKLHQVNIVHRDIRWDNVVYVASSRKWLLIDYETVWEANVKPVCFLQVFGHEGVLEGDGTYSKMSDLKLVGGLMDTVDCSWEDLLDFRLKLRDGYFTDAASALDGLEHYLTREIGANTGADGARLRF